jgi:hypothetical protein
MFRRTILTALAAIILALCVPAFVQGADKGDAVLSTIPADAIFCVRINNLNRTTSNLDQYIIGISPMPVSSAGLIKGQLGMMFGNFELKGFDVNGSFAAFATVESGQTEPDIYILLPVTDYAQLTDPNFRVSQPDSNGISAVGMGPSGQFFVSKVRSFAMMSKDYRKLGAMAHSLSGEKAAGLTASLDAAQVKQSSSEPIWAYANMVKVSSVYKKQISDGLDGMKKQAVAPNSPAFMAGLMNAFAGYAREFMQQSKSITLSCNPKPAVLNFRVGLDALPGTEMAGMFVADGAVKNNPLLGYTEDGAAMNLVGRINHPMYKKLNAKCVDLMAMMVSKDANDPNIVKTKKLLGDCVDSIGDFVVCSFKVDPNVKPFFDAKYVLEVKDANLFNKMSDEFVKLWAGSAFNDFYKSMGMETGFTVKRGAENYKGVSIDAAKLSMKFTDTNSPQAKALETMYGSGFEYRWAIVNGLWVCRISGDPNAIYKLIDQVKAGTPAQACSEMQKAISIIPDADSRDAIVTYNYLRLMKAMQAFAPMPFTMPDVPSKSNLVFAHKIDNGSLTIDFALPKEHLSEMMMAFQQIMMQQQQMPGQMPQGMQKQLPPQMPQGQPMPLPAGGK